MSKIAFAKAFYDQFYKFLGEMSDLYPEDPDFRTFETFMRTLQKTNPMQVIKIFNEQVEKFSDKINAKDESYFLNYSYAEYGNNITDIVGKLAGYFQAMDSDSKNAVWEYLYVLKELSKKTL